jgi:dephospho-CoA kinase
MLRVGLTGGLASGKSFVGQCLAECGCFLIKADELGHQALAPDGGAYAAVVQLFGPSVVRADGTIDRHQLGAVVFADPAKLEALNAIVHPAVRRLGDALMKEYAQQNPDGIVVYEAAILVETGSFRQFDRLIVAVCTEEEQIARAMARDGSTREEVLARLRRQFPLAEKVKHAHYVVDTSGTREQTRARAHEVYRDLVQFSTRRQS